MKLAKSSSSDRPQVRGVPVMGCTQAGREGGKGVEGGGS